ncbi:MAG TPA: hypothetical protein VGA77_07915, partial [Propylenella sp.]
AVAGFRDRITGLRRVRAGDLRASPKNWRRHPEGQRSALRAILDDVGFVGAVLARELKDGSLELLDGHLRAEIEPDAEIPVLVVDLDDREAAKVLATFDPVGDLALPDADALAALLQGVDFDEYADLRKLHADLAAAFEKIATDVEARPASETEHDVPGMELAPHEHYDYLVVLATTTQEWNTLCDRLGLKPERRRRSLGTCRAIRAQQILKVLDAG